jgi:Tfp pilus assembly protein PilE
MKEKEKEQESNGSSMITYIIIAIIASVFIGIRVYTKYLEKQNQEAIERIMQKNMEDHGTPFFNH